MKLSRCVCLVVVVVVDGAKEEYSLGPGKLYYDPSSACPDNWMKLKLRNSPEEVKAYAQSKGVEIKVEATQSGVVKATESVAKYRMNDGLFYSQTKTTAMYLNRSDNEMMLYATDDLSRKDFMNEVIKSHGEFILQDDEEMNMLQYLPGCTVCIKEKQIMDKFKTDYKIQDLLEWKFTAFVMKDKTLRVWQGGDKIAVTAAESKRWNETSGAFNEWDRDCYVDRNNEFSIIAFLDKQNVDLDRFYVTYEGGMDEKRVEALDRRLSERVAEQKSYKPIVYGQGCQDFARYLKDGRYIRYDFMDSKEFKELGDIAKWTRKIKTNPP
eukprot:GHVS01031296.1.p1 GENE.GHVS01031296.1~~GHVS01031296.1.p1  ORF type:complete len:324 (+),score=29.76 GHVS01031296.1:42-1013(+)